LDRSFLEKREQDARNRVRGASQGTETHHIGTGLAALGTGLFSGLTGVVTQPVKGAKKEGALGFLKGVAKGGIGLVARPIVGVVDLGTHTVQGIQGVVGAPSFLVGSGRHRPPRTIPASGIISIYDEDIALAQAALSCSRNVLANAGINADQQQQETFQKARSVPYEQGKTLIILVSNFRFVVGKMADAAQTTETGMSTIKFSIAFHEITDIIVNSFVYVYGSDGHHHRIKTPSEVVAQEIALWIRDVIREYYPRLKVALFGVRIRLNITDLLKKPDDEVVSVVTPVKFTPEQVRQVAQVVSLKSGDFEFDFAKGSLYVEYTRGPTTISVDLDLKSDVVL
jgi:hypothetical protein